jgi:hypothetical protein
MRAMDEKLIKKIERLQAVEIRPSDVIVATVPLDTDPEELHEISAALREAFAPNKVICMTSSIEVEVHRPGEDLRSTQAPDHELQPGEPALDLLEPHASPWWRRWTGLQ